MAVNFATLDARSLSQLCADLQGEPAQVAEVILQQVAKRLKMPHSRFTFNIMPYGSDMGPSLRDEWTQLIQAGRAFAAQQTFAASVGNLNVLQLRNPSTNTGRILVKGSHSSTATALSIFSLRLGNAADQATAVTPQNLLRTGGAGAVGVASSGQVAAVTGVAVDLRDVLASTVVDLSVPGSFVCALAPGDVLSLWQESANQAGRMVFWYAEVPSTYPVT